MKSALNFLFIRAFKGHPLRWALTTALAVAVLAAEIIFIVPVGEEEFLFSKMIFIIVLGLIPSIIMLFIGAEISGSRFVRAVPFAKALYTRAVPVFTGILCYGSAAVFMLLYAAGVLIIGESAVQTTEMLTLTAVTMPLYAIIGGILSMFRMGVLFMIYIPFLFSISMYFIPEVDKLLLNGFGLPLWAAVLIFVGGAAASAAVCCIVNSAIYKKRSFKAQAETMMALN